MQSFLFNVAVRQQDAAAVAVAAAAACRVAGCTWGDVSD
jgi:hypothetical protein